MNSIILLVVIYLNLKNKLMKNNNGNKNYFKLKMNSIFMLKKNKITD